MRKIFARLNAGACARPQAAGPPRILRLPAKAETAGEQRKENGAK